VLAGDHAVRRAFEQTHPLAVDLFGADDASRTNSGETATGTLKLIDQLPAVSLSDKPAVCIGAVYGEVILMAPCGGAVGQVSVPSFVSPIADGGFGAVEMDMFVARRRAWVCWSRPSSQ
jgi:hypothetical protein